MKQKYFTVDLSNHSVVDVFKMIDWCRQTYGPEHESYWGLDLPLMVFLFEEGMMLFQLRWLQS
jgi:hypothetical protein